MNIPTRILSVAGGLFFLIAFISSFTLYLIHYGSAWKLLAALAAAFLLAMIIIHWASTRMNRKMFLAVFLSLGFAVRMAWILWNPAPPQSDFLFMHNAALQAVSGDFSFGDSAYFTSFPYQLGFTMYEASVMKLFGHHLFYLKLLNVLFSSGTAVVLYYSASRTFNENAGRIAALFYLFYLPNIMMCSVLTNQYISTFLFLLGCLLLLRSTDSKIHWLLAGLALGFGNLMRPIGAVYLAAIFLFFIPVLWRLWRSFSKRQAMIGAAKLGGVIAAFYLLQFLASASLVSAGVTHQALSGGDKYWKLMVGLNAETNGSWNMQDARYANRYPFGEERHRAERIMIMERLENKSELAALMGRKLVSMWGSTDSSPYWSLQGLNRGDWERELTNGEGPLYILMCAFGFVSMIGLWRSGRYSDNHLYLLVLLLYAAAHLLIEIQTRYRLDLIPAVILLQSFGFYQVYVWVRGRLPSLGYSPKEAKGLDV
ncbi:glycosyltransferase family 39 protein [Cohnella sp. CFH 77786]|uniref:ArnT family glycosyltransferase n=1 Tax=Cohnella sp. CFH 77786 TaxID=2662265 RepID=UPI001C60DA24|nr:glycosyltransferase family 39 protein [Cohnella sp. CFH 77786]